MNFMEIFWIRLVGNKFYAVSESMKRELESKWKIKNVVVLRDQPNTDTFKPLSVQEKHNFFF